eukprot:72225-Prymnesium_polylepis.1
MQEVAEEDDEGERCDGCGGSSSENGNELLLCDGDGCTRGERRHTCTPSPLAGIALAAWTTGTAQVPTHTQQTQPRTFTHTHAHPRTPTHTLRGTPSQRAGGAPTDAPFARTRGLAQASTCAACSHRWSACPPASGSARLAWTAQSGRASACVASLARRARRPAPARRCHGWTAR